MSISYINKALKKQQKKNNSEYKNCTPVKTKSSETDDYEFLSDSDSITNPYSPGYFASDREDFSDSVVGKNFSPQISSSGNHVSLLNTLDMPERASVDLGIPLDPTIMSTAEERRSNPRSTRSGSAQEIMDIEKKGENLFNSSIRNSQSSGGSLSPTLDPSIRFSTADAKRLSIISMNGKNSNNINANRLPTGQPSASLSGEPMQASSFKNPFSPKSHESKNSVGDAEADAFSIRNKMSLRRKSWSSSPPAISSDAPETVYKKPPTGKRRRSSLLASGDVLSMKMGVLKRTSSSRKDDKPYLNNSSDFSDDYEEALEATPDSFKNDLILFNNGKSDNSTLRSRNKNCSYLEVGPLETQTETPKMNKPRININYNDNRAVSPSANKSFLGENTSMRHRVQSIAENTRDQLRRSTIISSSSISSGNSATDFHKNQDLKPDYHDYLDFQYIKTPDSPTAPIDLDKAKSNSEEPSESAKKFVWMEML